MLVNGEYVVIEEIQHEITEEPVTVYNFQVADFHTYYAGESSVLVHNADASYGDADFVVDPDGTATATKNIDTTPVVDQRTGSEVGRFVADDRGNVMIEPVGGSTVAAGRNDVDTHTRYPNGSNYQRYNPEGHYSDPTPHGHGHLQGTGPNTKGQGPSIDVSGNVVPTKSNEAHWSLI